MIIIILYSVKQITVSPLDDISLDDWTLLFGTEVKNK